MFSVINIDMPMDVVDASYAERRLVEKILPILKPYLEKQDNDKDLIDLLKQLINVHPEFRSLLDIFIK